MRRTNGTNNTLSVMSEEHSCLLKSSVFQTPMLKSHHGCPPSKGAPGDAGGAPGRPLACPMAGSRPTLPLTSREQQCFRTGRWQCVQGAPELCSVLPLTQGFAPNTGPTRRAPPSSRRSSWAARVWTRPRGACSLETNCPPGQSSWGSSQVPLNLL